MSVAIGLALTLGTPLDHIRLRHMLMPQACWVQFGLGSGHPPGSAHLVWLSKIVRLAIVLKGGNTAILKNTDTQSRYLLLSIVRASKHSMAQHLMLEVVPRLHTTRR